MPNAKVLIISPYFPPSNAADMHRVRMSLPYFKQFGWDATVVIIDEKYSDVVQDELLVQSIPAATKIYKVKALSSALTSKVGLGSLALRSLWYYRKKVSEILKKEKYDLVYFSTTQFPLCILGAYWKKRFGIPYVIDMQDPWHSDYYQDKPKDQQPSKYWFSYRLHKYLEPIAMKQADGLISVSAGYISNLKARYPVINDIPSATITFGAFEPDLKIALDNQTKFDSLLQNGFKNIVYVGRGGVDMQKAISPVFEALKKGLAENPGVFGKLRFYFIGTSYAPAGTGKPTILPLAKKYGLDENVVEITDRISYYHTLLTLQQADALFIPGSDDPRYTASKVYPYLLTGKPLLAIFNEKSNAVEAIKECTGDAVVLTFNEDASHLVADLFKTLTGWGNGLFKPLSISNNFKKYSSENLTGKQAELFTRAIKHYETKNTNT
ncbi:glycosyltransferase [Mucilaginibacter sp. OK098]|uniref:glycosyltransferase n=1 Tax=Mucilaginibacter sp. OK098 TaxID=1855297 RepID=UPI0009163137|nr:glycosyltransferase [Mucilaginibacter sp. OK098]SHN23977.1 Glycosyl transferase 4-like [Mucilaginibacter sp. OK098]